MIRNAPTSDKSPTFWQPELIKSPTEHLSQNSIKTDELDIVSGNAVRNYLNYQYNFERNSHTRKRVQEYSPSASNINLEVLKTRWRNLLAGTDGRIPPVLQTGGPSTQRQKMKNKRSKTQKISKLSKSTHTETDPSTNFPAILCAPHCFSDSFVSTLT